MSRERLALVSLFWWFLLLIRISWSETEDSPDAIWKWIKKNDQITLLNIQMTVLFVDCIVRYNIVITDENE